MEIKFTNTTYRISSISFMSGKIICTDKEKSEFYAPQSRLLDLATYAVDKRYLYFKLDGKIIVDFKVHDYKEY